MGSLRDLTGVLAIFFAGSVVLAPVLAWSLRIALKPLTETLRFRSDPRLIGRVERLEGELEELRRTLADVRDGQQFERALGAAGARAAPLTPPGSASPPG